MKTVSTFCLFFTIFLAAYASAQSSFATPSPSSPAETAHNASVPVSPLADENAPPVQAPATPLPGVETAEESSSPEEILAAANYVTIVVENVTTARGWVSLEPGSRPAYVGIQGGTAPITLLRSPKGALYGYTGNTGNDFLQLLQGKESPEVALPQTDSKEALQLLPPPVVPPTENEKIQAATAQGTPVKVESSVTPAAGNNATIPAPEQPGAAPRQEKILTGNGSMQPFGLSTPEHVVLTKKETKSEDAPPVPKKTGAKKQKKQKKTNKKTGAKQKPKAGQS